METAKYILVMKKGADGKIKCKSICRGFNSLEILGLLNWKTNDIQSQINGVIKPDFVSRKVITEKGDGR
jgi:hypothetical protein